MNLFDILDRKDRMGRRIITLGQGYLFTFFLQISLIYCLFFIPNFVLAQDLSDQKIPAIGPPEKNYFLPDLGFDYAGQTIPAGAENVKMRLSFIELIDRPSLEDDPLTNGEALWADLIGREVSLAELYQLSNRIEKLYLQAGYPLIRTTLPPQELDQKGAKIKIIVISSKFTRLDIEAVPEKLRVRISSFLSPLIMLENPKQSQIERALLLAGSVSGVNLSSAVAPDNNNLGGSQLVISANHKKITYGADLDNSLNKSYGTYALSHNLLIHSPFGLGEEIQIATSGKPDSDGYSPETSPRQYYMASFSVPLGDDGLSFKTDYISFASNPAGELVEEKIHNKMQKYSLMLNYPLYLSRKINLTSSIAFDHTEQKSITAFTGEDVPISNDRLSVMRLLSSGSYCDADNLCLKAGIKLSRGVDILHARRAKDANQDDPLSNENGDAIFTLSELNIGLDTPLPAFDQTAFGTGWGLSLSAGTATSFGDSLLSTESLSINGASQVSGFTTSIASGDRNWWWRAEIDKSMGFNSFLFPQGLSFNPYGFVASGRNYLANPSEAEASSTYASSSGVGFKLGTQLPNGLILSNSLEFARIFSNDESIEESNSVLFSLQLSY